MKLRTTLAALGLLVLLVPAPADARTRTFSGSCSFSGPIQPTPPIGLVPMPGSHFSYAGSGTCDGALDGRAVAAAPLTVAFTDVATLFDTCELGPDVELHGLMSLRRDRFDITIDLARLAVTGPFALRTPHGGLAAGTATFAPADASAAPMQCATTGIGQATLSASFQTLAPLVGRRARP